MQLHYEYLSFLGLICRATTAVSANVPHRLKSQSGWVLKQGAREIRCLFTLSSPDDSYTFYAFTYGFHPNVNKQPTSEYLQGEFNNYKNWDFS